MSRLAICNLPLPTPSFPSPSPCFTSCGCCTYLAPGAGSLWRQRGPPAHPAPRPGSSPRSVRRGQVLQHKTYHVVSCHEVVSCHVMWGHVMRWCHVMCHQVMSSHVKKAVKAGKMIYLHTHTRASSRQLDGVTC